MCSFGYQTREVVKNVLFIVSFFMLAVNCAAQDHVTWEFSYSDEDNSLVAEATIDKGWHLYSQTSTQDFGPIPTSFSFTPTSDYTLVGTTKEDEPITEYDPNFEDELQFFKNNATFVQEVTIEAPTTIKGTVTYMVCNESICMPPRDVEFTIEVVENEK